MLMYVARPAEARCAAIILLQDAFGVGHHFKSLAERFAKEGYLTVLPELFHRTAPPGFEGSYTDFAAVAPHYQAMTNETMEADLRVSFDWISRDPQCIPGKVASLGFCMGGKVSFLANAILPLKAAVSFYGGGIVPGLLDRVATQSGPLLLFWGGKDEKISLSSRNELIQALYAAAKPYSNVEFSEAHHGYFCDERPAYHAPSARASWSLMQSFLAENLK
jgi:carboxymethylenebutenolidase